MCRWEEIRQRKKDRQEVLIKSVYMIDYFESEISDQSLTLMSSRVKTMLLVEHLISSVLESFDGHAKNRPALCSAVFVL